MTATTTAPMSYVIIVNMPGYLPESDPYTVDTIEEAREAVKAEAERFSEDAAEIDDTIILHTAHDGLSVHVSYADGVRQYVIEAVADYVKTADEYNEELY